MRIGCVRPSKVLHKLSNDLHGKSNNSKDHVMTYTGIIIWKGEELLKS
jgi:hypothetical protein